jgi:RNA polymerase sigma factor (sigma-70 family)
VIARSTAALPAPFAPVPVPRRPKPSRRPASASERGRASDEILATMAVSDSLAFAELHRRYDGALRRFAEGMLRDPHDAADVAQDTWARALSGLSDPPIHVLSVRPWLYAIARNACLDRLRDRSRRSFEELDEASLGAGPAPDEVLELRQRARDALADLARLSDRQRAAVLLRDVAGLQGDELAEALGTDVRRASWLLADAHRSLGELRAGQTLPCETARAELDHARVRTRTVRAHLDACDACGSYARRRVGSRLHLHGFALIGLVPMRLRGWLERIVAAAPAPGRGGEALRPMAALAAAALAAAVPAAHHVQSGAGHPAHRTQLSASAPARDAVPAVTLPAAPRHRAVVAPKRRRPAADAGTRVAATAGHAQVPAAAPAPQVSSPASNAPAAPVTTAVAVHAAPVRAVTHVAAGIVERAVPAAAPVLHPAVRAADDVLAAVGG